MNNLKKKKKGFTLIELIIVLAVMAIIALIAIPNFNQVRENSKKKADDQSCVTIERTATTSVIDKTDAELDKSAGTYYWNGTVLTKAEPTKDTKDSDIDSDDELGNEIAGNLSGVAAPQEREKVYYKIEINTQTAKVKVSTGAKAKTQSTPGN